MNTESLYSIFKKHPLVCTDTRSIKPDCLFFALKGERFNANEFAEEAIRQGAAYALIDEKNYQKNDCFILVDDVLLTLQDLARHHRMQLKIPLLGITGSNGKTTTKELINAVLSEKYRTYATQGNLNNHIGVPLTILAMNEQTEFGIVEMGANHQHEIELLSSIARPDYGLITNVGRAHLEGFGGFEGVKKGKKELYDHISIHGGLVFINQDNSDLREMAIRLSTLVCYGTGNSAAIQGQRIANGDSLSLKWTVSESHAWHELHSNLVGDYNFENLLAAVCIGHHFGLTVNQIRKGVESYMPKNNRSQAVKTERNSVVSDYYNANPSSMAAAITNFANLTASKKLVILADMFELGEYSPDEHRKVLALLKDVGFEHAILIGKHFLAQREASSNYLFFDTTEQALEYLKTNAPINSCVLLKGSRGMKLEALLEVL